MKLRSKTLQSLLFFLALLVLPFQLGPHFWPSFTIVVGQRIDYLSPTIYVSDVFMSLLFALSLVRFSLHKYGLVEGLFFKRMFIRSWKLDTGHLKLLLILLFLSFGIFFSSSPLAGWYGLLKLLELMFFGWYVASHLQETKVFLPIIFGIDITFESLLGVVQFVLHRSVGGIFYFFGERNFTSTTPGIANASLNGELVLRPYGTFPHPNVLAGFLLIGLLFLILFLAPNIRKYFYLIPIIALGIIGLFLSLSRIAILLFLTLMIVIFLKHVLYAFHDKWCAIKKRVIIVLSVILAVSSVFLVPLLYNRFFLGDITGQTLQYREILMRIAFAMWQTHILIGVGLNNFLPSLPFYSQSYKLVGFLQPVHNIYLLVLSETGVIGFWVFLLLLFKTGKLLERQKQRGEFWLWSMLSFIVILVIGFFDHYFLTLQQGQLLFALVLGACWGNRK